jgi:hypothetical protein
MDAEEERIRTLDGPVAQARDLHGMDELSSGSSEGTSSGRETPVFLDDELPTEPLTHEASVLPSSPVADINTTRVFPHFEEERHTYRALQRVQSPSTTRLSSSRTTTSYVRTPYRSGLPSRSPSPPPRSIPRAEVAWETIPSLQSTNIPPRSAPIAIPTRPVTPPNQASWSYGTPSPAPSVTPRLYNWRQPTLPIVGSPSSPLPNRTARLSVAHISPTITIQRVIG